MPNLEPTAERIEAARLGMTGNWNIEKGADAGDPVLRELVEAKILVLIYTPSLHASGLDGVRLTMTGRKWLARAEQESQR
jgi:hypothetical protein